jgi:hypothetical protein
MACVAACLLLAATAGIFGQERGSLAAAGTPTPTPSPADVRPLVKLAERGASPARQRQALRDYLRRRGVSNATSSMILANTSDSLALRPGRDDARTGIGGDRGLLPPGSPWPNLRGTPFTLIATIDFSELPRLAPLPADGTLALYYLLADYDPDDARAVRAYYFPPGAPASRPRAPRATYPEELEPLRGTIQPISGNPHTVADAIERRPDAKRALQAMNDLAYGGLYPHHLLGQPIELQAGILESYRERDPSGDWLLLAQINDGPLVIADGGDLLFLIRRGDLEARRFDRVRAVMESH